jgi:hypothetical protein
MTVFDRIVGAWGLARWETQAPDGTITLPYGEAVTGLLLFAAAGFMSGQIMLPEGEDFEPAPALVAGPARYIAYCGPCRFDEDAMTLTTTVEASVSRSWLGTEQVRGVELHGDRLILRPPQRPSGDQGALTWLRL